MHDNISNSLKIERTPKVDNGNRSCMIKSVIRTPNGDNSNSSCMIKINKSLKRERIPNEDNDT